MNLFTKETQKQNKFMNTKEERGQQRYKLGVWDKQIQITIYKIVNTHTHTHKRNHFAIHQKVTQHCKSTIFQLRGEKKA